ncbi:MAG: helix-turn-helix transcriptional regulator [Eubacteriales bacterium]
MFEEYFSKRVFALRSEKGISARDMSLSLGMSENYINQIENGRALPSMQNFFYICEFLEISPKDFFDEEKTTPVTQNELIALTKGLQNTQIENLKEIARGFQALNKSN